MTIGEHLEELRKRLVLGLVGFAVVMITFMVPAVGYRVVAILCDPLVKGMKKHGLPPQLHVIGLTEGFMTYLQICIVAAFVFAGPWLIYQLWLFIAAGLYPHERKTITKYIPLSLALLVSGVLFVYFLVLPLTVDFFLSFNADMPLPGGVEQPDNGSQCEAAVGHPDPEGGPGRSDAGQALVQRAGGQAQDQAPAGRRQAPRRNPHAPVHDDQPPGVDHHAGRLHRVRLHLHAGVRRRLPVAAGATGPGAGRAGRDRVLQEAAEDRLLCHGDRRRGHGRGDVVTATIALLVPMVLLYEFGIWLAQWGEKQRKLEEQKEDAAS